MKTADPTSPSQSSGFPRHGKSDFAHAAGEDCRFPATLATMLNALRYYWMIAKGYRLRPWQSPYIRWRMETFFGAEADNLDRQKFIRLMWRERANMKSFAAWAAERRRAQLRG